MCNRILQYTTVYGQNIIDIWKELIDYTRFSVLKVGNEHLGAYVFVLETANTSSKACKENEDI
jgi:hypothetical protein